MKNAVGDGMTLEFTAGAAITSGDIVQVGDQLVIAVNDVANGEQGVGRTKGVYNLPCLGTDVVGQGDSLYYDSGNNRLTLTASGNQWAGTAWAASGNGVTTVDCNINPGGKDVAG